MHQYKPDSIDDKENSSINAIYIIIMHNNLDNFFYKKINA